jgi:hypothetical protein
MNYKTPQIIINYTLAFFCIYAFVVVDDPHIKTQYLTLAAFNFTWARM